MLDSETKRRIDSARDILVGKVPDPKSQVEQITIALIYKFMDDMDKESVEIGGKAGFFKGEFKKYSWSNVFDPRMGGVEMLNLYGEAITRMSQNANLPQLFRDIFKNAYLPYRDPETLKLFLKTINDFTYDHSERLGDAFEYLLSVLGSQGDAGQFRTPRHIIDFMVQVVDPQKNETVLDPACGTAGFLISAYKHILKSNEELRKGNEELKIKNEKDSTRSARNSSFLIRNSLTTQEKQKLYENFTGYDISPDMVRLSLVNLYLHGFVKPRIYEYDSLASEERWNEYADVILANPPFMSPKGGIMPHKKFSVQSNRSEVLFVDYMAEHLTPNGRAAIIVPEGIIFQSGGAYKQLRKYLIEHNFLWAVVSLPAGVFNPYAGVKTSILFLDKSLAKKTDKVLFVKVENDGFDLGAQRRPVERNDLPEALGAIKNYKLRIKEGKTDFSFLIDNSKFLIVPISKLAETDYNLSADRYREVIRVGKQTYPLVDLGEVCEIISGQSPEGKYYNEQGKGLPFYQGKTEFEERYLGAPTTWTTNVTKIAEKDDILMSVRAPVGPVNIATQKICIGRGLAAIRPDTSKVLLDYVFIYLRIKQDEIKGTSGSTFASINRSEIAKIQIPLPPLEIQRQLVDEIAAHQRVIDGARQVVENWSPDIELELENVLKNSEEIIWKREPLVEVCEQITDGTHVTPKYTDSGVPFLRVTDITESNDSKKFISKEEHRQLIKRCKPVKGDVLYSKNGTIGVAKLVDWDWEFSIFVSLAMLKPKRDILDGKYLEFFLNSDDGYAQATAHSKSGTVTNLHLVEIKQMEIPLPPLEIQREIVARIERERAIVHGNQELIKIYELKIKKIIEKVWSE